MPASGDRSDADRDARSVRQGEADAAVAALEGGRSVILIGPPGSGRTWLADEVRRRRGGSVRVIEDAGRIDGDPLATVIRRLEAGERVVLTSDGRPGLSRPLRQAMSAGLLVEVALDPLPPSDLRRVLVEQLGEVDTADLRWILPARPGRDLRAMVAAAREIASSAPTAEPSPTADPVGEIGRPRLSPALREMMLSHLGSAGAIDETLLDLIALVPDAGAPLIVRLAAGQVTGDDVEHRLERLEEHGTVTATLGEPPRIRLTDGVVELLLPQTLAAPRRRRLAEAIVDALTTIPETVLSPTEQIALASLSIELGRDVPPTLLTAAARASLREDDPLLSIQLAVAATEAGGGLEAETALAAARIRAGRIDEVLGRMQSLTSGDDDARLLGIVSDLMLLASDRLELPGGLDRHSALATTDDDRRVALDAFLLFALGDWGGASRRVAPILDQVDGPLAARAHFVFAGGALLTGWFGAAERSLDRAEEILTAVGDDITHIRLARLTIGRYTGRLEESLRQSRDIRDLVLRFGPSRTSATATWTVGTLLLISGRVGEAVGELEQAIRGLTESGMDRMALIARCELAEAHAGLGAHQEALAAWTPVAASVGAEGVVAEQFRGKLTETRAWTLAAEGRIGEAADAFIAAAEAFTLSGNSVGVLAALASAARCGAAERVLPWLEAAADEVDDPYGSLLRDLGRALADLERHERDRGQADEEVRRAPTERLLEVGGRARALGFHLLSAEAFARVARTLLVAGDERGAASAALQREEQMRLCGIERLILVPHSDVRPLSLREAEIADLAAAGLSNREISERLVVSIRTVETHLLRVYKKLGIRRRGELADALRSAPRAAAEEH